VISQLFWLLVVLATTALLKLSLLPVVVRATPAKCWCQLSRPIILAVDTRGAQGQRIMFLAQFGMQQGEHPQHTLGHTKRCRLSTEFELLVGLAFAKVQILFAHDKDE
jgi:hypothetical protein